MNLDNLFRISARGERMVEELHKLAIEYEVICTQAPIIWDGDTNEDIKLAKQGCNGTPKTEESDGTPPCPLRVLCYETALEIEANAGVWGGYATYELRKLKAKREMAELRKHLRNQKKQQSNS